MCNPEFVRYLLDLGADPNGRGHYQAVPLVEAVRGVFEYKRIGPGQEVVELLLARGADVNLRGSGGSTALFSASQWGMTELVRLLLTADADPDLPGVEGWTALMVASGCDGDGDALGVVPNAPAGVVAMLLAAGANPCAVNSDGDTALDRCWSGYRELLERAVADWIATHP
jgi:ankyrin repeat protein